MYSDDIKLSSRYKKSTAAVVNAAINHYNEAADSNKPKRETYRNKYEDEAKLVVENTIMRESIENRYHSFAETIRTTLLIEALYKLFDESTDTKLSCDNTNASIMRAITSQYVHENGYAEILSRMKYASVPMSKMYNVVTESAKKILNECDKKDPETFVVTPEMKDEFFKSLDYSDSSMITDAIKTRVADAMEDFVTANNKDHEDINATLKAAQEKIAENPDKAEALKESYEMRAKRKVLEIRNAPKGVLHSMISSMCESVMKHPDTHSEFIVEGHLDMDKIVDRTTIMYTFMEMLNTAKIDKIDSAYIEETIKSLSK